MILGQSFLSRFRASCISIVSCLVLIGCGGGGSGNSPGIAAVVTGQALLGPLTGAMVTVYDCKDLNHSIYTATTSESTELNRAGLFDIPNAILEDNALYLMEISGGRDIDANDDGVIDNSPTDNRGTLHLMATGTRLKAGLFRANILTDIVYHKVSYLLFAKYPVETILQEMTRYTRRLIKSDVDGNGQIGLDDLLWWDPVLDKGKVAREWSFFENCIQQILGNTPYLSELSTIFRNIAGTVDMPGNTFDVTVSGNYAYVTAGESGLQIIDVSNPTSPAIVGAVETPENSGVNVAISGNHVYVADGSSGLQVIDIGNPANPAIIGAVLTPFFAQTVTVSGNYAYVADSCSDFEFSSSLQIIDVSNPANPTIVGAVNTPGRSSEAITVSGNYLYYVADYSPGLLVIDVGNPRNPTVIGSLGIPENYGVAIAISGNYAYITNVQSGLMVVDVSNPASPVLVSAIEMPGVAEAVTVSGNYAYVAGGFFGIQVIDISNPANPTLIGVVHAPHTARALAVSGNYAYTISGDYGLYITDVSNLVDPTIIGALETRVQYPQAITVSGNYAFITNGDSGLEVINIGNPVTPILVGAIDMPDALVTDIAISGNYAFLSDRNRSLQVIDIGDPTTPNLMGAVQTPYPARALAVSGNYVYMVDGLDTGRHGGGEYAFHVIDIGNPANPFIVGGIDMPHSHVVAVTLSGNYAFVVDRYTGLKVIDVNNPANPAIVGAIDAPDAYDVTVLNNYAYVACAYLGLQVIDVSNPRNPALVGTVNAPGFDILSLAVSGNFAYGIERYGLIIIDIGNPAAPAVVGTLETPGYYTEALTVSDNFVYTLSSYGLTVYQAIAVDNQLGF
ncbi:MAG: hypothetical protein V2B19_13625 [Pseudomonadota bacterium]